MPKCPFNRKPCMKDECEFWDAIPMKNMQTGEDAIEYHCTFRIQTMLLMDNNRRLVGQQQALEQMRNIMHEGPQLKEIGRIENGKLKYTSQ